MAYQQQQQPGGAQSAAMAQSSSSGPSIRGADYVVFERLPQQQFSRTGLEKATAAKLKLEHYYKKAVDDVVERNGRCAHSTKTLQAH